MSDQPNLDDRMFLRGEAVYAQIARGEVQDVTAALMNAHLEESTED